MKLYNKTTDEKFYGGKVVSVTLPPSESYGERGEGVDFTVGVHMTTAIDLQFANDLAAGDVEYGD